jgi:Ca2+-binding EF-hand superfamily protein
MGENYSDKETDLLLEMIDSDGLGVVEFPELVRWWCDESCGEESLGAAASSGEE